MSLKYNSKQAFTNYSNEMRFLSYQLGINAQRLNQKKKI